MVVSISNPSPGGDKEQALELAGPNVKLQVNERTGSNWIAFLRTELR